MDIGLPSEKVALNLGKQRDLSCLMKLKCICKKGINQHQKRRYNKSIQKKKQLGKLMRLGCSRLGNGILSASFRCCIFRTDVIIEWWRKNKINVEFSFYRMMESLKRIIRTKNLIWFSEFQNNFEHNSLIKLKEIF